MKTPPTHSRTVFVLLRGGKYFSFGLLVILGLIVLLLLGISLKGRWDLVVTKKQLLAQGEKLTLAELTPPLVPDAENFFADPMWVELEDLVPSNDNLGTLTPRIPKGERQLDGLSRLLTEEESATLAREFPEFASLLAQAPEIGASRKARNAAEKEPDVDRKRTAEFILAVQTAADPLLTRILTLTERTGANFPIRARDRSAADLWPMQYLLSVGQFLGLKAWAEIELGQADAARRHISAMLRLSDILVTDPMLFSLMVRTSLVSIALLPVNEGIKSHLWTDTDLREFENRLAPIDLQSGRILALRGERGGLNEMINPSFSPFPQATGAGAPLKRALPQLQGFFPQLALHGYLQIFGPGDQAAFNQIIQAAIVAAQGSETLPPQDSAMFPGDFHKNRGPWFFTHIITSLSLPALAGNAERIAQVQTQIDQTRIACALERFRIAQGEYPKTLTALVPHFLAIPLLDGINGRPMSYHRLPNGEFLLFGPGRRCAPPCHRFTGDLWIKTMEWMGDRLRRPREHVDLRDTRGIEPGRLENCRSGHVDGDIVDL